MGSSASKAAKSASKLSATNTARKYPTRSPTAFTSTSNPTQTEALRPSGGKDLGPSGHPEVHATGGRDPAIQRDGSDPDLEQAHSLRARQLGPVTPNPTQSNSSTFNASQPISSQSSTSLPFPTAATSFTPSASAPSQTIFPTRQNPAVSLLTARYRLAEEAEKEFAGLGRKGSEGRSFLDVQTLRQVLVLRGKGVQDEEIERNLDLKRGVVKRLGEKGVVGLAG